MRLLTRAATYSLVFGIGYGLGLGLFFGLTASIATGITLAIELNRASRGLNHHSLPWEGLFSAIRGFGYGLQLLHPSRGPRRVVAIRVGLLIGIVTGVGATVNPYIEYYADNLPERRLGVFGIGLILFGFALQSLQYRLSLFDVHLT